MGEVSLSFRQYLSKSTGERLFAVGYFYTPDIKIAVIGLTTDDTAKIGNPEYFTDIEFRKPAEEAKVVIQELNMNEKPDVIIATTHMGHYDNGDHGSNAPGDVEMARSLPAGSLAMIVGGHHKTRYAWRRKIKTGELRTRNALRAG